ncbi:hypothetical protein B0H13DRAFT_1598232, partial [Mycena leptocephala]
NNLRLEGTFLAVDQLDSGVLAMVRLDSDTSTIYQHGAFLIFFCPRILWAIRSLILGTSSVNISWYVEYLAPSLPLIATFVHYF